MTPKVSVVIPPYNAQQYLGETLDCLAVQTLREIEVLVVDDGSADSTPEILREYSEKYPFIRAIRQENAGVAAARNRGIQEAAGEYLYFLDSDDLIEPDALEQLYQTARQHEAELVICKIQNFSRTGTSWQEHAGLLSQRDTINPYDYDLLWNYLVGNKLYLTRHLRESGVLFPPLRYSEDGAFNMRYAYCCTRISGCPNTFLRYRRRVASEGFSVSQTISLPLLRDYMAANGMIYDAAAEALKLPTQGVDREAYLDEVLYKTAYVLIAQFYRLFWRADEACITYIAQSLRKLREQMSADRFTQLCDFNSDIEVRELIEDREMMAKHARVSFFVTAKGSRDQMEALFESLYMQTMPCFEVFVPQSTADAGLIPAQWAACANLHVLPDHSFLSTAKKQARARLHARLRTCNALDPRLLRFLYRFPIPAGLKQTAFSVLVQMLIVYFKRQNAA